MVTGEFPFSGPTPAVIMAKHIAEPPPDPGEKNPILSRPARDLVQRMMAKDPADRPQTPADLLAEVRDALEGKTKLRSAPTRTLAAASSPLPPGEGRVRDAASRLAARKHPTRLPWLLSAAGLLLAAVAGSLLLRPGHGTPPSQANALQLGSSAPGGTPRVEPTPEVWPAATGKWEVYKDWPFDAGEAVRRQEATAKALGANVEQEVDLGGGVKMPFVLIPAGEFLMGSSTGPEKLAKLFGTDVSTDYSTEHPHHRVTISRPFWMAKCLLTREQWMAVVGANPSQFSDKPKNPVENIDWYDAARILGELSQKLGKPCRLPTEAEWEYACRAGTVTEFYFGNDVGRLADFAWVGLDSPGPVGLKKPNAWGLHDMAGNLWEMCADWYGKYDGSPQTDPKGPPGGTARVKRGGAWSAYPRDARSACRIASPLDVRSSSTGLRVVLALGSAGGPEATAKDPNADPGEALFDGKSLRGWKVVGQGKSPAVAEGGQVLIRAEQGLCGMAWQGAMPKSNYEITLEATRIAGPYDFCDIVFPIGNQHACWSFGAGPKGNHVTLNLVNGGAFPQDEAARTMDIQNGRWYKIRIRVTEDRVEGWTDDVKKLDLPRAQTKFSIDDFQTGLKPFGISTWHTQGAVRNLRLRRFQPGKEPEQRPAQAPKAAPKDLKAGTPEALFDGKSLRGWRVVGKGQCPAIAEEGQVLIRSEQGQCGVVWQGAFPTSNYEVALEAMRVAGPWDFCDLVFPIGGQFASWDFGVGESGKGISFNQVDGGCIPVDEAARIMDFQNGRWYKIRIRVTDERVEGWLDEKRKFDVPRAGTLFAALYPRAPLKPFGIGTWYTKGAVRNLQLRRFQPGKEAEPAPAEGPKAAAKELKSAAWESLFDGKSLRGWTAVGRARPPAVAQEGQMFIGLEYSICGIAWQGDFPKLNYEVTLDVMSLAERSGFCNIVFPIGDLETCWVFCKGQNANHAALSLAHDAYFPNDEAAQTVDIQNGRWYPIRIRVTEDRVEGWMDDVKKFDLPRAKMAFSLHNEFQQCLMPFGIGTWYAQGALRNIQLRRLPPGIEHHPGTVEGPKTAAKDPGADEWEPLFDGKSLRGWNTVGERQPAVVAEEGQVLIRAQAGQGAIVWQGAFPKLNYEVSLEAMRIAGPHCFAGVQFPIGDQYACWSFGWTPQGNQICLERVNGGFFPMDAAARITKFQDGRWYKIRIRVAEDRVQGWMDDVKKFDLPRAETNFSYQDNQPVLKPFWIGTWWTQGAFRNIQLRRLRPGKEVEPGPAQEPKDAARDLIADTWEPLFDGKNLPAWKIVATGRPPAVAEEGQVLLRAGPAQSGMAWQGGLPKVNYEFTLEAMRIAGPYDFCDIVFPVGGQCAGWMMGTSSTGKGALLYSYNGGCVPSGEAARVDFQNGRWYKIHIRVTDERVEGWMDDVKKFDLPRAGANFSTEERVNFLRPFGIGARDAQGAVRNLQFRCLRPGKALERGPAARPKAAPERRVLATVSFAAPSESKGLTAVCEGDGRFATAERAGKPALCQEANNPDQSYLYFRVADGFAKLFQADPAKTAIVTLSLLDAGTDFVCVQYDSHIENPGLPEKASIWRSAWERPLRGTGHWTELEFELPGARFGHRQNYGADFRLWRGARQSPCSVSRATVSAIEEKRPPQVPAQLEQGLAVAFYAGKDHDRFFAAGRASAVASNWDPEFPAPDVPGFDFSARIVGWLYIHEAGEYTFRARGEDGARLYLDGKMVLGQWLENVRDPEPASVRLAAGWHRVWVEHRGVKSRASLHLCWCWGETERLVPATLLYCERAMLDAIRREPTHDPFAGLRPLTPVKAPDQPAAGPKWQVYKDWPFDAAEAVRRHEATAKALGVKVEQEFELGNGVKMALVLIPAGEFLMGSPPTTSPQKLAAAYGGEPKNYEGEFPQHRVTITRPFWMGKCEVTQEQYVAVLGANPSGHKDKPKNPVEQVDWKQAGGFAKVLSEKLHQAFRLPTEAEWEYACRAGAATEFYFGDDAAKVPDFAWCGGDSTARVGAKKPNAWGLCDMAGNVWEWVADWHGAYGGGAQTDPKGPPAGELRGLRGGSWGYFPRALRSAYRNAAGPEAHGDGLGFRLAIELGPAEGLKQEKFGDR
jgi:formylglycine-generating enzyme required for sulfatase activity